MAFESTGSTNTSGQQTYAQHYLDPKMVKGLAQTLGGVQQGAASQYLPFIQNPTAHPLYQTQISGLLQSLMPSEDRARTSLTDTFRAAGGLRSGAYGREATMLEGELMGRRQQTAAALLGQMFPQVTQALQNPMNQTSSLINALKLNYGTGQSGSQMSSSSGWDQIPQSLGLQTPMTPSSPQQQPIYGGGATVGPNAPGMNGNPAAPQQQPYVPYLNPWTSMGGGNPIAQNPYTGYYETVPQGPMTNPYEHTYSEWTPVISQGDY